MPFSARVETADRERRWRGLGRPLQSSRAPIDRIGEAADVPDLAGVSLLGEPRLFSERRSNHARHPLLRNQTAGEGCPGLRRPRGVVKKLEHVSEAKADPTTSVVAVTFAGGGWAEQQEIERAIKGAGYVVSRRSVRSDPLGGTY